MNQSVENMTTPNTPVLDATRKRSLLASGVGNVLEWYDWTIYAIASVYIATALFNKADPASALLSTLAVFAVGFVSRPLGGFIFGPMADKIGRRNVLMITMFLMAGASVVIALIPSYESIGYWSSLILLMARLVQGFAHGGEQTTSYAYIAEIAPPEKRGLWASSIYFSVGVGSLIATLFLAVLTSVISKDAMMDWGWRIPFLLGGALAIFALYLRRNMMESEAIEQMQQDNTPEWPLSKIIASGIKVFFYVAGATLTYYIWVTCVSIYAITHMKMDPHDAFVMSCMAQVIYLVCLPFQGWLSDKIGRKACALISFAGSAVLIFPLWSLISDAPWTLFVAQAVGLVFVGFMTGSKPAAISEQIPTRYRTKVLGIFMSLAIAIFGGTASYINAWMYLNDIGWLFNVYTIVICIFAIAMVLAWKNNKGIDLDKV